MHRLQFRQHYWYPSQIEGIRLPVTLKAGGTELEIFAFVDTGATYCMFPREYAELLDLDVETGHRVTLATVAGTVEAFGVALDATVFFFANERIQKNVLGRNGWLNRIRLGLVEYEQQLFLSPYESDGV